MTCRPATTSGCLITGLCCGSRSSATPTRSSTCWWRPWRAPAPSRSARWAPTPRSPCCRQRPRMLYDYFQQLFAQVTNPPLDAIREEVVTSLQGTVGPEGDLLNPNADSCRQIVLTQPILRNAELLEADLRRSRSRDPRPQARHARRGDSLSVPGQPRRAGPQGGARQCAGEGVGRHPRRRAHHRAVRPRIQTSRWRPSRRC